MQTANTLRSARIHLYKNIYMRVPTQHTLQQRRAVLERARQTLKSEFIGIDAVIDQVIDSVASWYLMPALQDRPIVINLWGLTGTGKTSLVNRMAEMLSFDNKHYSFNLGDEDQENKVFEVLRDVYQYGDSFPAIITLDEFQHVRSVDEAGHENEQRNVLWQLLDTGRFETSVNREYLNMFNNLKEIALLHLKEGLTVRNGKAEACSDVSEKYTNFTAFRDQTILEEGEWFLPLRSYKYIMEYTNEKYSNAVELQEKLHTLDGDQTIQFLNEIIEEAYKPIYIDCSKTLIFVIGNLDEAYKMAANFNPDMSADSFHKAAQSITISHVKNALKRRFRIEQIARLGNNHIIYPAFSRKNYEAFISLALDRYTKKLKRLADVDMVCKPSIHSMIYKEGVIPTMGTRPVLSTLHQQIGSKLGLIIAETKACAKPVSSIVLSKRGGKLCVDYYGEPSSKGKGEWITTSHFDLTSNLERLRRPSKDDAQAIVAVHEAGHAVVHALVEGQMPELIVSVSADDESQGFTQLSEQEKFISKEALKQYLATLLAGMAAETVVFGADHITSGSSSDLQRATSLLVRSLKSYGFGKVAGVYQYPSVYTNVYLNDYDNRVNDEARIWLQEALDTAKQTLEEQKTLLVKVADYLADNRMMKGKTFVNMVKNYAVNVDQEVLQKRKRTLQYRNRLKALVKDVSASKTSLKAV